MLNLGAERLIRLTDEQPMRNLAAEREHGQLALERRSPGELVAFILSLADVAGGIGNHVHAFICADEPAAAAAIIAQETEILCAGQYSYSNRARLNLDWAFRAMRVLDAIETFVLPRDRVKAAELLTQFLARGDQIVRYCDGDDPSDKLIERAQGMLASL